MRQARDERQAGRETGERGQTDRLGDRRDERGQTGRETGERRQTHRET